MPRVTEFAPKGAKVPPLHQGAVPGRLICVIKHSLPVPGASRPLQLARGPGPGRGDSEVPRLPSAGRGSPLLCHWALVSKGELHPSALGRTDR